METFAAATLPSIRRPMLELTRTRIAYMAVQLRSLAQRFEHVVMVCSIEHWPWLREAYFVARTEAETREILALSESEFEQPVAYAVSENSLVFLMGELPYITGVYEQARHEATDRPQEAAIDGVKQLLMSARASYLADLGARGRRITPLLLSQCLKYIRNLTLLDRRLTPDLYTICIAAKQVLGDQYAIHVVEAARNIRTTMNCRGPR